MNCRSDTPLRLLKGVGETTCNKLAKLRLLSVGDLVDFFPRRYEYRGETTLLADAEYGELCSTVLTVCSAPKPGRGGKVSYVKVSACDESGTAVLTFFNQPWIERALVRGRKLRVWGRVRMFGYSYDIASPEIEPYSENLPAVLPVYPLTKGLTQQLLRRLMPAAAELMKAAPDVLPEDIRLGHGLMKRGDAIYELHFPESREKLKAAKRSLAFEELLLFQLAVRKLRRGLAQRDAPKMGFENTGVGRFFKSLPFELTKAQQRAAKEVLYDLCRDMPMRRMIQGDVGSGKTVVAAAAMLFAVKNGLQCALMAPTEILAAQHYDTLSRLFSGFGVNLALLTGSRPAKEKREIRASLASGAIDAVVGTNAIIQKGVDYKALGLVITDEQHRFGVLQRSALADKAEAPANTASAQTQMPANAASTQTQMPANTASAQTQMPANTSSAQTQMPANTASGALTPHALCMSATPIPRSLSLIMYGDMDLSVIDELPPGRQVTETRRVSGDDRAAVYAFLKKQIEKGGQAYIICPLIEDDEGAEEGDDRKSVNSYKKSFGKALPEVRSLCLHGRMKGAEKDAVMRSFAAGEADVLISTTVVEVGVDVPNATIMLIENAECFGLSQLHQLRGRVGRGREKSYCLLLSERPCERLEIMCRSNDGFEIANADLAKRGPGDFFGSRQSGEMRFLHADALDMPLIEETRALAEELCETELTGRLGDAVRGFFSRLDSANIFN